MPFAVIRWRKNKTGRPGLNAKRVYHLRGFIFDTPTEERVGGCGERIGDLTAGDVGKRPKWGLTQSGSCSGVWLERKAHSAFSGLPWMAGSGERASVSRRHRVRWGVSNVADTEAASENVGWRRVGGDRGVCQGRNGLGRGGQGDSVGRGGGGCAGRWGGGQGPHCLRLSSGSGRFVRRKRCTSDAHRSLGPGTFGEITSEGSAELGSRSGEPGPFTTMSGSGDGAYARVQ